MLIGSRSGFAVKPKPTAKSYAQDGLIALWDGIENVGWGKHNNNSLTWTDLIGGHILTIDSGGTFGDNCLICDGTKRGAYGNNVIGNAPVVVEAVVQATLSSSWRILWHQSTWRDGNRLTRCLVYRGPDRLWLASAYGYTNGNIIVNPASLSIEYKDSIISLKVNGNNTNVMTGNTSWYYYDGGNIFGFGGASSTSSTYALACKIYCFRLYSRALTADEIAANYAVDKARFNLV